MFQNFPYTDMHQLNLDWIIAEIAKFKKDYGEIDKFISDALDKYIEEHPDYNVHNNSLTSIKLNRFNIPFYNVTDFDILPDSGDVYHALHDLMENEVYETGGIVYFPKGTYTLSYTVFIPENTIILGDGANTEIYFNETDVAFGTAFCNAGSNVCIMNLKMNQLSTGTFLSQNQPGCIGFTNIAKRQCKEPYYSHNFIRDENLIEKLTAKDITFSGRYAIQTEPGTGGIMADILYENLTAEGAISVQVSGTAGIRNININNCKTNVLRLQCNANCSHVHVKNLTSDSLALSNGMCPVFENYYGTANEKTSTIGYSETKYTIAGDVIFKDSIFNDNIAYQYGMRFLSGIRTFENCVLNFQHSTQMFHLEVETLDDNNYFVMNNCRITAITEGTKTILTGYGKNNVMSGHIRNLLWGDTNVYRSLTGGIASTFPNRIECNENQIVIKLGATGFETESVYELPSSFNLPIHENDLILIYLWNSNNLSSTKVAWGKIDNGVLKVTEYWTRTHITDFTTLCIAHTLHLSRIPTPKEILDTFGVG